MPLIRLERVVFVPLQLQQRLEFQQQRECQQQQHVQLFGGSGGHDIN